MKKKLIFLLLSLLSLRAHGAYLFVRIQNDSDADRIDVSQEYQFYNYKTGKVEQKNEVIKLPSKLPNEAKEKYTNFKLNSLNNPAPLYVIKSEKGSKQNTVRGKPIILNKDQANSLVSMKAYLSIQSAPSEEQLIIHYVPR